MFNIRKKVDDRIFISELNYSFKGTPHNCENMVSWLYPLTISLSCWKIFPSLVTFTVVLIHSIVSLHLYSLQLACFPSFLLLSQKMLLLLYCIDCSTNNELSLLMTHWLFEPPRTAIRRTLLELK